MKKIIFSAMVMVSAMLLTSCEKENKTTVNYPVEVSNGAYVLCSGNMYSNIDGSMTYIDYAKGIAAQHQFKAVNGRSLGSTPNDALVFGSKMYIAVTDENTIEVVDSKTLKSLRQIKLTELMGTDKGVSPRKLAAYGDQIYVTTYGASSYTSDPETWAITTSGNGFVAAIDTINYTLSRVYEVGSFPEGLALTNGYLFVANSDYSAQTKASISVIKLSTGEDFPITDPLIVNPTALGVTSSGMLYVLDMGNYYDIPGGIRKLSVSGGKATTLFDATCASFIGSTIFACNNVYGQPTSEFMLYDIKEGISQTIKSGTTKFFYPNVITGDLITGKMYVASYSENPDAPGTANYSSDGYVLEYSVTGELLNEYPCGVGPTAITFNTSVENREVVY